MRRVVVTGMAGITAFGDNWADIKPRLAAQENAVVVQDRWLDVEGLNTKLSAPVLDFEKPSHYKRKQVRGMGRVALMATRASELALAHAGLLGDPLVTSGDMGISYGSSAGTPDAYADFSELMQHNNMRHITATSYIELMAHTTAVNMGIFFQTKGRVITTSSACTSGSQGIGYAYEAIKHGQQTAMIAGGAEELCVSMSAVFDTLYATSTKNDAPKTSPSPFDMNRDGLVIGEGAGTLILEEYEHAVARGATIYAEIVGFGTNSDGNHVTQPTQATMAKAMELALEDAQVTPDQIGFVSAHGTATPHGDVAETNATAQVLGKKPISSLKSYFGHTLGACGAVEAWFSIEMMRDNWFHPTINLSTIDPDCGDLDYLTEPREIDTDYVMTNNFAFGGINTSLILKRL